MGDVTDALSIFFTVYDENTPVSGCDELAQTPLMQDHNYTGSSFIVVDRRKFENMSMSMKIESHLERFGLQQFATSLDDFRYQVRNQRIHTITFGVFSFLCSVNTTYFMNI